MSERRKLGANRDPIYAPDGTTWYDVALEEAEKRGNLENDIERLRSALENARRDLLGVCPKYAAGGRRRIIKEAVARIEAALASPQSGER